jgi:prepilin-type N-terminal cleavage/methylation domain-containing protein
VDHVAQLIALPIIQEFIVTYEIMTGTKRGVKSDQRDGFTLIELMISVALSLLILLVAVAAFRLATQTMGLITRLSRENGMLRTGYFVMTDDVDFWNSHANPNYPYLKGHMSDTVGAGELGNSRSNNLYDKRPFKAVTFRLSDPYNAGSSSDSNFDPNWSLPNDRRSWYRNGMIQGPRPFALYPASSAVGTVNVAGPVIQTHLADAIQLRGDAWYLLGWEPWHIYGDYSMLSNVGSMIIDPAKPPGFNEYGQAPALSAESPTSAGGASGRGARPTLMWRLFQELGHVGVYTYMPPGTINLIQCPNYNNTVANIGRADKHYCKGEMPWSMSPTPGPVLRITEPNESFDSPTYTNAGTVSAPSALIAPDSTRSNYSIGAPGSNGGSWQHQWVPAGAGAWWHKNLRSYSGNPSATSGTRCPFWLADLEQVNGNGMQMGRRSGYVGLFYGHKLIPSGLLSANVQGGAFDSTPLLDRPTRDPFLALNYEYYSGDSNEISRISYQGLFAQQARDYSSTTVHFPRNITDDTNPNLTDKPEDVPALSTTILRYRHCGADKALCQIRVQDPATGRVLDLSFTTVGSTFRGARQHWGWKSMHDQPAMRDMGDNYGP